MAERAVPVSLRVRRTIVYVVALMSIDVAAVAGDVPGYRFVRVASVCFLLLFLIGVEGRRISREARRLYVGEWLLFGFAIYQIFNAMISMELFNSFLQAVAFTLMMAAAFVVSRRVPMDKFLSAVLFALVFVLSVGAIVSIALPDVGRETLLQIAGSWRGISNQKNIFGALAATVLSLVIIVPSRVLLGGTIGCRSFKKCAAIVFASWLLYMSSSRGAELFLFSTLGAYIALSLPFRRGPLVFVLSFLSMIVLLMVVHTWSVSDNSFFLFGREISSSSRLIIWEFALRYLPGHEWFGYGTGGFWTDIRFEEFYRQNGWALANFHNGYLSILLEGGFIGLLIFLISLVFSIPAIFSTYVLKGGWESKLVIAYLFGYLLANLFENHLGQSLNPQSFIFFALIFYSLYRSRLQDGLQPS